MPPPIVSLANYEAPNVLRRIEVFDRFDPVDSEGPGLATQEAVGADVSLCVTARCVCPRERYDHARLGVLASLGVADL